MGVGELDADVFLVDAWQFAVEFVGVFNLLDVEARLEGADAGGASAAAVAAGGLRAVDVVVVEEAEERTEVRGGGEGLEE